MLRFAPVSQKNSVDRRGFLKGAAAGLVAGSPLAPQIAMAQQAVTSAAAKPAPPATVETATTTDRPGSDFMIDVIKSLGIEYCAANPGTSFRGLHESIINYGGNHESRVPHLPATRNPRSPWRTATPRSKASR